MKMTLVHNELERRVTVLLDGDCVARTDYDETGWAGLELVQEMARDIARKAGWEIAEEDEEDEE